MYKNEKLIQVFEDTKGYIKKNKDNPEFYESKSFKVGGFSKNNIQVINTDSVSALVEYKNFACCLLNMASPTKAGGGVVNGAKAQEESLFRCSNLFDTVEQKFYPIKEDELIYSRNVVFFKDHKYKYMDHVSADVVTIPAINLNEYSYYDDDKNCWVDGIVRKSHDYEKITKQKIRLMLNTAINYDVDVIILGAWGCGVFKNSPHDIAKMFKEVLIDEEMGNNFYHVIFPIINDKNSVGNNYQIFYDILNNVED